MTRMTLWNPFQGITHIDPTTDAEVRGPGRYPRWNELAIAPDMHAGVSAADAASRLTDKGNASSREPASSAAVTLHVVPASMLEE